MHDQIVVGNYLMDVKEIFNELHPASIWNMDEMGFNLEHQPSRV